MLRSLAEFEDWFASRQLRHAFTVERIPFSQMDKWFFESTTGNLVHISGRFFKIEGVWVETNYGGNSQWAQPIIHQPEIGILGILTKKFNGVLHFLMQGKMEPGNLNMVQLAPTLQATRSNYTCVHEGKKPPYLDYFMDHRRSRILVDVLQSEQGARFLRKRNRNIIIEMDDATEVPVLDDFFWLTLGQIHQLLRRNNLVNMDARTVLSCITFESPGGSEAMLDRVPGDRRAVVLSALDTTHATHTNDEIISWFTEQKVRYELNVERIPLKLVRDWIRTEDEIRHVDNLYFKVVAVRVTADNREVPAWTQPLLQPHEPGIAAFIVKPIHGVLHFLVQAKVEPGNFDVVEMAPTVQCLTGSYRNVPVDKRPLFLAEVLNAPAERIVYDAMQSEEGGRFFREENRNRIVLAGADFPEEFSSNYIWMTMNQIKNFTRYNNFVNVQCRSLLACLGFA